MRLALLKSNNFNPLILIDYQTKKSLIQIILNRFVEGIMIYLMLFFILYLTIYRIKRYNAVQIDRFSGNSLGFVLPIETSLILDCFVSFELTQSETRIPPGNQNQSRLVTVFNHFNENITSTFLDFR